MKHVVKAQAKSVKTGRKHSQHELDKIYHDVGLIAFAKKFSKDYENPRKLRTYVEAPLDPRAEKVLCYASLVLCRAAGVTRDAAEAAFINFIAVKYLNDCAA